MRFLSKIILFALYCVSSSVQPMQNRIELETRCNQGLSNLDQERKNVWQNRDCQAHKDGRFHLLLGAIALGGWVCFCNKNAFFYANTLDTLLFLGLGDLGNGINNIGYKTYVITESDGSIRAKSRTTYARIWNQITTKLCHVSSEKKAKLIQGTVELAAGAATAGCAIYYGNKMNLRWLDYVKITSPGILLALNGMSNVYNSRKS